MPSARDELTNRRGVYLTVEQACEYLGIRRAWFFRLVKRHNIPRYQRRIGRKVYYRRYDLMRLLAHDKVTDSPGSPPPADLASTRQ